MEDLKRKTFRLPSALKTILDETDWREFGYVNDSDVIRQLLVHEFRVLGLLPKNKKSKGGDISG